MNEVRLPDALARALAAEAAWLATDRRKHPRIDERRHQEYQQARKELAQQYPALAEWLFGWESTNKNMQRRDEILRVLKEVIAREH